MQKSCFKKRWNFLSSYYINKKHMSAEEDIFLAEASPTVENYLMSCVL
jgi:hypothetical protein